MGKSREIIILKKPCTESKKTEYFRSACAFLWLRVNAIRTEGVERGLLLQTGSGPRRLPDPLTAHTHTRPVPYVSITWLGLPTRITNALKVRLSLTKLNVFINRAHKQWKRLGQVGEETGKPVLPILV